MTQTVHYSSDPQAINRAIMARALRGPFDADAVLQAARDLGYDALVIKAIYPAGFKDMARGAVTTHTDRLRSALALVDTSNMKVREKIAYAVKTRLELCADEKAAMQSLVAYASRPAGAAAIARPLWAAADMIWRWAGDTATDYNHYTKRSLLLGVMASTTLFWLQDTSAQHTATWDFLNRRIEDVLKIGGQTGAYVQPIISKLDTLRTRLKHGAVTRATDFAKDAIKHRITGRA